MMMMMMRLCDPSLSHQRQPKLAIVLALSAHTHTQTRYKRRTTQRNCAASGVLKLLKARSRLRGFFYNYTSLRQRRRRVMACSRRPQCIIIAAVHMFDSINVVVVVVAAQHWSPKRRRANALQKKRFSQSREAMAPPDSRLYNA